MRKLILHMAITVDGVVAPEDQQVFDHSDEGVWGHIFGVLDGVDGMLIGAGMHREYLGHWQTQLANPTAPASERRFAEIAARTPHFVLSRTPQQREGSNATVLAGGVEGIAELKKQAGRDLLMWGGARAASATLEAGYVDELHLVTHPVIAGPGKKLFDDIHTTRRLRHEGTVTFPSGIVILKYAAARPSRALAAHISLKA